MTLRAANASKAAGGGGAAGGSGPSSERGDGPFLSGGPTSPGGSSALQIAGGAVAAHKARGEAPDPAAKRGAARGLRGSALDALAGDGGVGRERVSLTPGSVSFGDIGHLFLFAPEVPSGSSFPVHRRVVVQSWLSAKASVARSSLRVGFASLDRVVGVGTALSRRCQGSQHPLRPPSGRLALLRTYARIPCVTGSGPSSGSRRLTTYSACCLRARRFALTGGGE